MNVRPSEAVLKAVDRQADELTMEAVSLRSLKQQSNPQARSELLRRSLERVRRVADALADAIAEDRLRSRATNRQP